MLLNTQEKYGWVAKILHWLVAIAVFCLFGLGLWMVDLGYYDSWNKLAPHYHKSVGILLMIVMFFRVAWRLFSVPPAPSKALTQREKKLSHGVHIILYVIIFLMFISGYLISTADNRGIEVFDWFTVPSFGAFFENQEDIAGNFHEWLAYILIGFAVVHLLAALKHHFINKDDVLKRMF
jgi:cytochrome b561